ncbi:UNVERIFIED_CONTAM: hypothetical protein NCL1_46190 [Trichonephila clavipes]
MSKDLIDTKFALKFKNLYRWRGHRGEKKDGEMKGKNEQDGGLYWSITYTYSYYCSLLVLWRKSTRWWSVRTWQNERDSDYVEEDRKKMALTT